MVLRLAGWTRQDQSRLMGRCGWIRRFGGRCPRGRMRGSRSPTSLVQSIGAGVAQRNIAARCVEGFFGRRIHPPQREIIAIDVDNNAFPPARTVDIGLGGEHPVADVEWEGASVQLWATGLELDSGADVLVDGPHALLVCVATLQPAPPSGETRGAMMKVVSDAALGGRKAAFLAVVPTRDDEAQLQAALEAAASGDGLEALTDAVGWVTWQRSAAVVKLPVSATARK